jgi:hypothetical protein
LKIVRKKKDSFAFVNINASSNFFAAATSNTCYKFMRMLKAAEIISSVIII